MIVHAIPRAGAQRSHLRLRSWFSNDSNVYFRPSNRLSEPTGSISITLEGREQGTYMSALCQVSWIFPAPCYCTFYSTLPSQKQRTHSRYLSRQMSYDSSFLFTATAYRSEAFSGFLSHTNDSPTTASILLYIRSSHEYLSKSFPRQLLSPYVSSLRSSLPLQTLCYKIFVLKYFRRTPTLRKFFNTKIFPTKISYNENFPIYGGGIGPYMYKECNPEPCQTCTKTTEMINTQYAFGKHIYSIYHTKVIIHAILILNSTGIQNMSCLLM